MRTRTTRPLWPVLTWILAVCLCGLLPAPAMAQGSIHVTASTHASTFGQEVRFALSVSGQSPIQSIVLAYRTSDTQGTTVKALSFAPGLAVNVEYVHDIGQRYMRPFVQVTYWWTITDAAEARLVTEPQTFVYGDDRFAWQTVNDDEIRVHWYHGDLQIAQQALDVARAGLTRARLEIDGQFLEQARIDRPFDIYMYASPGDLNAALPDPLPMGAEALTMAETQAILVSFGPLASNIPHIQRVLPHEMTHALIYAAIQSDLDRVPYWLTEGLATSVQYDFAPDPDAQALLDYAVGAHTLIPLDTLCAAFPGDLARARLAYAQSASLIGYIRDMYGHQGLRDLVAAYADGASCEGGVQRVLGMSLSRLEAQWLASLAPQSAWLTFWQESGAWLILLLLFAALPLAFLLPHRSAADRVRAEDRGAEVFGVGAADHAGAADREPLREALASAQAAEKGPP